MCGVCVRERKRECERVNRVYERLAARLNATDKGIRVKRTSYVAYGVLRVAYELIRSTSYVASSSTREC